MRRMVRFGAPGISGAGFRLSVSPGGCSGLQSEFTIEPTQKSADRVLDFGVVTLFVSELSYRQLEGVLIDFVDSQTQTGLVFVSPAANSCGCASEGAGPVKLSKL